MSCVGVLQKIPSAVSNYGLEDDWEIPLEFPKKQLLPNPINLYNLALKKRLYDNNLSGQTIDEIFASVATSVSTIITVSRSGVSEEDMLFESPNFKSFGFGELKKRGFKRINNPRKKRL